MKSETRTRKKYASGRTPQAGTRLPSEVLEPAELWTQMQAVAAQVARLQRAAKRMSRRPQARTLPAQDIEPMTPEDLITPEEWTADQERRKAIFADLIAKAQALVPDPPDSPTRKACRESPIDEILVEKFRRQGFNL